MTRSPMGVHFDVLGWLYVLCGIFGVLTGASLGILALGSRAALADLSVESGPTPPAVLFFIISGLSLFVLGISMIIAGRAVIARSRAGRAAALALGALNLFLVPFGTGLGIYTFWALLNDDARIEFGRPPRR